jgi:hypothetical protein
LNFSLGTQSNAAMVRSLLVLALAAAPASAQTIYRWTDAKGVVHYSDDASNAPKGVKVETTGGAELVEVKATKTPGQSGPREPVATVIPVPPPPAGEVGEGDVVDDEEYWRHAFQAAREKIRKLEEEVATRQRIIDDPRQLSTYGARYCGAAPVRPPGRYGGYAYWSCLNEIKQQQPDEQKSLERAKEELHDLEVRAANAAVPLEWRR